LINYKIFLILPGQDLSFVGLMIHQ